MTTLYMQKSTGFCHLYDGHNSRDYCCGLRGRCGGELFGEKGRK